MEFDEYLNPFPKEQPPSNPLPQTPPAQMLPQAEPEEKFLPKPIEPTKEQTPLQKPAQIKPGSNLAMWLMFIITISSLALLAFNQWQTDKASTVFADRNITVVGEGIAYAIPDVAKISFGVRTENKKLSVSQKQNADTISNIKNKLTNLEITSADTQSLNYTVNPNYDHRYVSRSVLTSYSTYHFMQITVNKLDMVDAIIQALGDMGATDINQVIFTINDPSDIKNEAREKALAEAQDIAEQLAGLSGASLGEILEINEEASTNDNNPYKVFKAGGANDPNIDAGMFSATSKITITYSLE